MFNFPKSASLEVLLLALLCFCLVSSSHKTHQAKASKKHRVGLRLRDNTRKSRDLGIIRKPGSKYLAPMYLHIIIFPRRKLTSNDRFNGAKVRIIPGCS